MRIIAIYSKLKRAFLVRHYLCRLYPRIRSSDVHHQRGRAGTLLIDQRFWMAVSRRGHNWIHNHPQQARYCGYLCAEGLWNVPPRDAETARLRNLLTAPAPKRKHRV